MISVSLLFFGIASLLVIGGGIGVVVARNIIHAALFLLVTMIGTAGVFLLALAEFLALVQILIYGGAVLIVILFALMLTRIEDFRQLGDNNQKPIAALISIFLFILITTSILMTDISTGLISSVSLIDVGLTLFTDWAIPFEVASLVLLIALIGAIVLVREEEDKK